LPGTGHPGGNRCGSLSIAKWHLAGQKISAGPLPPRHPLRSLHAADSPPRSRQTVVRNRVQSLMTIAAMESERASTTPLRTEKQAKEHIRGTLGTRDWRADCCFSTGRGVV